MLESAVDQHHLTIRLFWAAVQRFRPPLGWAVLGGTLFLMLLPAIAIREAQWIDLRRVRVDLEWVGVLSLLFGWWTVSRVQVWGMTSNRLRLGWGFGLLLWSGLGTVTISQVLVHWLPGPLDLWRAAMADDLFSLISGMEADLSSLLWRYEDWLQGVQGGGAYQDDFVFLSFFAVVLWLLGGATALLALSTRNGLLIGLPALWVLATFLFYGQQGRTMILLGFATALLLHVLLDQQRLERSWTRDGADYSSALLMDRMLSVAGATALIIVLAALFPNIVVRPIAYRIYRTMTPVYDSVDEVTERMFPDLKGGRRGLGRLGSGLPNRFLLEGGTELSRIEVMRVSTNYPFGFVAELREELPRLYMRRGTFVNYDGRGWENAGNDRDASFSANRAWRPEEEWPGRVAFIQRVRLTAPTAMLPAAGEPAQVRMDYELERRSPDDLVSVWSRSGPVDRFDVISYIPALSVEELRALPVWGEAHPLPAEMAVHLEIPDTVTQPTRDLAASLAAEQSSPFAIAAAIEAYLRGLPYNLEVPGPPPGVDVAHFFLFDLQQGYCDYYATAFSVLARLNGLPTRFATGYIGGYWDLDSEEWTITEAEAHSWPEVYFPEIGWVPFEPTAGRPSLQRQGLSRRSQERPLTARPPEPEEGMQEGLAWNWQMLFWLLPLLVVLYVVWSWLEHRPQDPWLGLLAWGRRIGRPYATHETELEYGQGLVAHVTVYETEPERRRRLAGNVTGMTAALSEGRYGKEPGRASALTRAGNFWRAIRRDSRRMPW